jgi:hypothetical protein
VGEISRKKERALGMKSIKVCCIYMDEAWWSPTNIFKRGEEEGWGNVIEKVPAQNTPCASIGFSHETHLYHQWILNFKKIMV